MEQRPPIRLLTAVPLCDGHDSAVTTINLALIDRGFEVVYMGYNRSAEAIVQAAIQEDVMAIGISSYNGGHIEFFTEVLELLHSAQREDIGVFGGGGATITPEDAKIMLASGTDAIFPAGTTLDSIVDRLNQLYGHTRSTTWPIDSDSGLGRMITNIESATEKRSFSGPKKATVIGITGPGGAGKTTLIDEWIRAARELRPAIRIAVLSHDPSCVTRGGLLGDRASMIYAESSGIFIRSMATRGVQGGLSKATEPTLEWMTSPQARFDIVFVETVGTGQEALPFDRGKVDRKVLVLHPEYGAKLQLQKILMLQYADDVVINKSDWPGSRRAMEETRRLLGADRPLYLTCASQHRNQGVAQLVEHWLP